jgi:MtN3 and saliva related transmembrane protein
LTSLSYLPQVKKAWPRDSTEDLSLSALTSGLALWIIDELAKVDRVIVAERGWGNALGYRVVCKIRGMTAIIAMALRKCVQQQGDWVKRLKRIAGFRFVKR